MLGGCPWCTGGMEGQQSLLRQGSQKQLPDTTDGVCLRAFSDTTRPSMARLTMSHSCCRRRMARPSSSGPALARRRRRVMVASWMRLLAPCAHDQRQ